MMFLKPVALSEYEVFAKGHFEKAGKQIADDVESLQVHRRLHDESGAAM